MPAVSVVIPVHNAAPYLPALFQALVAQALADLEFILIDDGSSDGSAALLDGFVAAEPRAQLIRHATPQGVSRARNAGITVARGRYIGFCDADDVPAPQLWSSLLAAAEAEQLDVVLCNGRRFEGEPSDSAPLLARRPKPEGVLSGRNWLVHSIEQGEYLVMVYLTLVARRLFEGGALRFVPAIVHEDVLWMTDLLLHTQRLRYLNQPLYHYRRTPGSITEGHSEQRACERVAGYAVVIDTLLRWSDDSREPRLAGALRAQARANARHLLALAERQTSSPARRRVAAVIARHGLLRLLWQRAQGLGDRRRIARVWMAAKLARPTYD
ncbi:glycosyltransferase [Chitinimonas lacunae]|uniref:Glycosyltransferase n=1 Tax=Chitinimonas lacunae TaxID=1963018 RepID=A0ABV8MR98_9NEIS